MAVNVVSPDGETWAVDEAEAKRALENGYHVESPVEAKDRADEAKYGDRPIAAGLAGGARGISLGLSDWAGNSIWGQDLGIEPGTLGGLEKHNKAASTVGEVAGTIAGLAIPGLGEISGPGLAAKAGGLAERALVGEAKSIAGRAAAKAISGSVEGGFFGAGHALSESVLGDGELTAEKLLSSAGVGALLGGGVGATLGGLSGALLKGSSSLQGKAVEKIAEAESKAASMAQEEVAADIASKQGKLGAETQKGNRILENILRLEDMATPEQKAALSKLKKSGDIDELAQRLVGSNLGDLPGQKSVMDALRTDFTGALAGRAEAEATKAADILSPSAAFQQVKSRVDRYAAPLVGRVAGGLAGSVLGPVGALGGAMVGEAALGFKRPMQQALERMLAHPAVKKAFWEQVKSLTESSPQLFQGYGQILEGAAIKGADQLFAVHAALAQRDPNYREVMANAGFAPETPQQTAQFAIQSHQLNRIQGAVDSHDKRIDAALGRFIGKQGGATPSHGEAPASRVERLASFQKQLDALSELTTNPQRLASAIQPGSMLSNAAPSVATLAATKATQAAQYLMSVAPKNPHNDVMKALSVPWQPTDAQLASWERTVRALNDPSSVLSDLRHGTVTKESLMAMKAVYPRLLDDMRNRMGERLATHDKPLTYQQRASLAGLMEAPVGEAATPARTAVFQQAHTAAKQAKAAQEHSRKQSTQANNLATQSQKVEGR